MSFPPLGTLALQLACSPVGLISLMVKRLHLISRTGQDSIPDQALIFSGACSTT